jgi:hypothetical protein
MSRGPSQDSTGAHSQRNTQSSATNSYDQSGSTAMYLSLNQVPFHMSSARSDVTGRSNSPANSDLFSPTQHLDDQVFSEFTFQGAEDISGASPVFHRNSTSAIDSNSIAMTAGPSYTSYATAGEKGFLACSDSLASQGYDPSTFDSPTMWATEFTESQRSSPTLLEDSWLPPPQMLTSTTTPLDYSPSLEGLSPRFAQEFSDLTERPPQSTNNRARKPGPRPSKVASDLASTARHQRPSGTSEASDESSIRLVGRSSLETDNNARIHYLYRNAAPKADGLYHCPWEEEGCQHKPEKLKCNYEYATFPSRPLSFDANNFVSPSKCVDSHLKPYRCKVHSCENLQFSSTACLLRHEREAHAMHGHGEKPFLCTYEGCDRGVPGNGFPRHWNLRDHMKRVHNDPGAPKSNASGNSPPPSAAPVQRGKKRKAGDRPESPSVERAVKRVATPIVETPPAQEPSAIERHQQAQKKLLNIVQTLSDPKNSNYRSLLRDASKYFKVIAETTQSINTSAPDFTQASG